MKELNTASLMKYIKHAIDLESAVVTQNQIIEEYEEDSQKRSRPIRRFRCRKNRISHTGYVTIGFRTYFVGE